MHERFNTRLDFLVIDEARLTAEILLVRMQLAHKKCAFDRQHTRCFVEHMLEIFDMFEYQIARNQRRRIVRTRPPLQQIGLLKFNVRGAHSLSRECQHPR